jgi:hypothetical protein
MNNRDYFAAIAAAVVILSAASVPAAARGAGGFGGHAGFATRGAVTRSTTVVTHRGSVFTTRTTTTTSIVRMNTTGRLVAPIRPEVITLPATFGTGAIVPPFSGAPIVPPFGATTAGGRFDRLPSVAGPYGYLPGYGYAAWLQPEASPVAAPSVVPSAGESPAAMGPGSAAAAAAPASPCHPIPNGYHCDWPS